MQEDRFGHFARSCSGHDSGSWYVVVGEEGDRILVADGRLRKMGKPKAKNPLHIKCANDVVSPETQSLIRQGKGGADEAIKREIKKFMQRKESYVKE